MSDKTIPSLPARGLALGAWSWGRRPADVRDRLSVWPLLVALLCAALLALAEMRGLTARHTTQRLDMASREAALLVDGFHAPERDARGSYRWSNGDSRITFGPAGAGGQLVLHLGFGPPPALPLGNFTLELAGQPAITLPINPGPRQYQLLAPRAAAQLDGLTIGLKSATVSTPADPRPLGLRFEGAALGVVGARVVWPAPALLLAQTALLLLGALVLRRLRVPLALAAGGVALLALAIFATGLAQPLLIARYSVRLAVALALLASLTYWLLPWAERVCTWIGPPRVVRALWGIMLLACAIRLAGAVYPLFSGFDLALNVDRLTQNLTGQLVITRRSIEFHNGITIYPPGPYLAFMPGLLLGLAPPLLVQASIALFDGMAAFAIGALARALGASGRAALLAALLYAAVPVGLTTLWFGLTAQVFGQALMAPLALALLAALCEPRRITPWMAAAALLGVAVLSHIGVTIVAFVWLGLAWLLLARRGAAAPQARCPHTLVLVAGALLGVVLLYADVAALKIQEIDTIGRELVAEGYDPIYALIWRGFLIAFHPLVLLLLPIGLALLLRQRRPAGAGALTIAWLGTALLFLLVEIATGLQVRYIYFLTPLACILAGLLLDRLAARGVLARWVAWAVALLLLAQGTAAWLTAAFNDQMMSMVSLLR
ncbi:MAG: hypothetical protein ACJ8CR_33195 [Roseiflexaceae bacterium]